MDNIFGADLADTQLIRFLLCVIDLCSKYAWFVSLKDKNDSTITNALQKILD